MTATIAPLREVLTVDEVAALLGISRSAAYRLRRHVPSYRLPGVGLRFARADIEAWIAAHRRDPAAAIAAPARRRGTRVASARDDDDEEVLPGLTRRQLREQARSV